MNSTALDVYVVACFEPIAVRGAFLPQLRVLSSTLTTALVQTDPHSTIRPEPHLARTLLRTSLPQKQRSPRSTKPQAATRTHPEHAPQQPDQPNSTLPIDSITLNPPHHRKDVPKCPPSTPPPASPTAGPTTPAGPASTPPTAAAGAPRAKPASPPTRSSHPWVTRISARSATSGSSCGRARWGVGVRRGCC